MKFKALLFRLKPEPCQAYGFFKKNMYTLSAIIIVALLSLGLYLLAHGDLHYYLAKIYKHNHQVSHSLLLKSAKHGNINAQYELGIMLSDHFNKHQTTTLQKEKKESGNIYWLRRAAEEGHKLAPYRLGLKYFYGTATEQNFYEASYWLKRSIELGRSGAHLLAELYETGKGVEKDISMAIELYTIDANNGDKDSSFKLAQIYDKHYHDIPKALHWYELAGEANHVRAQEILALLYEHGIAVDQNYNKSAYWYNKLTDFRGSENRLERIESFFNGENDAMETNLRQECEKNIKIGANAVYKLAYFFEHNLITEEIGPDPYSGFPVTPEDGKTTWRDQYKSAAIRGHAAAQQRLKELGLWDEISKKYRTQG